MIEVWDDCCSSKNNNHIFKKTLKYKDKEGKEREQEKTNKQAKQEKCSNEY